MFENLIINAVKAMPEGGQLTVSLDSVRRCPSSQPRQIEVRIQDTGTGLSPEALKKIFVPFHSTRGGGMGLGLTICLRIIEQHCGNIITESKINGGTAFIVRLPVRQS